MKPMGSGAIEGFVVGMMGSVGSDTIKNEALLWDDGVRRIWRDQRLVGGVVQGEEKTKLR